MPPPPHDKNMLPLLLLLVALPQLCSAAVAAALAAAEPPPAAEPRRLLLTRATADGPSWKARPANGNVSGSLSFGGDGLTVTYDFTRAAAHARRPGSAYMGATWTPPHAGLLSKAPLGSTLEFQLKTNVSRWGFLRVVDSTGQIFQSSWSAKASPARPATGGEWRLVEQKLHAENFTAHFMGADDGVIHLPLAKIEIDLVSPTAGGVGQFSLANLSLSCSGSGGSDCSALEQPFASWDVALGSTASLSTVGVATQEVTAGPSFAITVQLANLQQEPSSLVASVSLVPDNANASGVSRVGCVVAKRVSCAGWDSAVLSCVPSAPLLAGFWSIEARLMSSGSTQHTALFEGGLAVILQNLSVPVDAKGRGAFGSQLAHTKDHTLALGAMGASNYRAWMFWRYTEGHEGNYEWTGPDRDVAYARAAGLRVTLTIASRAPRWAVWSQDKSGAWPSPAMLPRFEQLCRLAAERYAGQIDSIEIDNEPDAMLWDLHLPLEEAAREYQRIVAACSAGVQSVASWPPTNKLIGLSVSGQGYWLKHGANLTFAKQVLADPATTRTLHALSVHPYARSHWIPQTNMPWGRASWVMPNETADGVGLAGRLNQTVTMMRSAQHRAGISEPAVLWPTEFGYSLFENASSTGWEAATHAAAVAQSLLLMRSNANVERFFLFAAAKAEDSPGSSYAIWGDKKPRPAVSAFATCAQLTDSPRFETGFRVDAGSHVAALHFRNNHIDSDETLAAHDDTLALWLNGPTSKSPDPAQPHVLAVHLSGAATAGGPVVRNGFGRLLEATDFNISVMPVYVQARAESVSAILTQIRTLSVKTDDDNEPPVVSLGIEWGEFLSRHDPVWRWNASSQERPPDKFYQALFGGNAMLGFMLWQPTNLSVRVDISRADVYDDRSLQSTPSYYTGDFVYDQPRLPIGHFDITFDAPTLGAVGRLSLWNAEASYNVSTAPGKTCELRAWALSPTRAADADVIVLEVSRDGACGRVEWMPEPGDSLWKARTDAKTTLACSDPSQAARKRCACGDGQAGYGLCKLCSSCADNKGCLLCNNYVSNPLPIKSSTPDSSGGRVNVTSQKHLRGTAHSTAIFECTVTDGDKCGQGGLAYFTSVSAVLSSQSKADRWAVDQVTVANLIGAHAMKMAHRRWWHAWWQRGSFVTYEYTVLESLYFLMQYKYGSAARRGRAFHDLNGAWLPTVEGGTNAPDVHWDWNIQGMYYLPFLTNRPEIAASLIDYVEGLLHSGVLWAHSNVPVGWEDGAAAPTGASGLSGESSCYWNHGGQETLNMTTGAVGNCTATPPSVTGNLLWTLHAVHQSGVYVGNATVAKAVVFPLLVRSIRYYSHFWIENSSLVSLPPTFSPEYPGPSGPNANYDNALLRWGLHTALQLDAQYDLGSPDAPMWRRVVTKLIGPSLDSEGRFAVYEGVPLTKNHRHFSHLLALWPLRELPQSGQLDREKSAASLDLWSSLPELDSLFGRGPCASMNADLGRHAAALDNVTFLARTRILGSGWYGEGGGYTTVCNEASYLAAYTLADWLLQSWNATTLAGPGLNNGQVKVLELFKGVPNFVSIHNVSAYEAAPASIASGSFFRLAAEGGFMVSAAREQVTAIDGDTAYRARTVFIAVESSVGGPCVVRIPEEMMARPLRVHPSNITVRELGDGGLVQILIGRGQGVAIWSGSSNAEPPKLVVTAKNGCPTQRNFWGGGVVANPESLRKPSPPPPNHAETVVVLRPCKFADGLLSPSQRWQRSTATAKTYVRFELLDGSNRCLTVTGTSVVLRPCLNASHNAGEDEHTATRHSLIGCQRPWTNADSWPRDDRQSATSQDWTFSRSFPNGIQSKAGGECLQINGGQNPLKINVDECQRCFKPCTVNNMEWSFNVTSGALVSLCAPPCQAGGWCLTDAAAAGSDPNTVMPLKSDDGPRYLLMNMQYHNIPKFKAAFEAAVEGPPAANPALAVGVSTLFNLVNNDTNSGGPLLAGIEDLLSNAVATKVPVFLGIDGENWWANSGLVNWFDPKAPGFDPANRHNVEWTAADGATSDDSVLKISWRNWGRQIRVSPQQNFHSPKVMAAYKLALRTVIPVITKWYNSLPAEEKYLLAGIKVGWEASIGWNAYYYPGGNAFATIANHSGDPCHCPAGHLPPCTATTIGAACHLNKSAPGAAWGMQQLGYAAATSAGLTPSGPNGTLSRADIAALVQMYLGNITAEVKALGFPLEKLFTHLGGTMVDTSCELPDPSKCDPDKSSPHIPFSAGITGSAPLQSSTLGVSVYARPPAAQPTLALDLERAQPNGGQRWAAVEWGLGTFWQAPGVRPHTVESWVAAYNATLSFGDCRLLAYYNWAPSTGSSPDLALVSARKMLESWSPPHH